MVFARVRETLEVLRTKEEAVYDSPREQVERYLPGMDHYDCLDENEPPSLMAVLLVGIVVIVPASTFISGMIGRLMGGLETGFVPNLVGWAGGLLTYHFTESFRSQLPARLINKLAAPLEVFGVRRIRENFTAIWNRDGKHEANP